MLSRKVKKLLCTVVVWREALAEEKKPGFLQYNIEGKELESFMGPLEASVMEAIWCSKKTSVTVREIHGELKKKKKIAYTTVMTTMDRLYEKGLLNRKMEKGRGGLCYVYWPVLEKLNFQKSAVREVLASLIDNFGEVVASCLIEGTSLSEEERKALREQLSKTKIRHRK